MRTKLLPVVAMGIALVVPGMSFSGITTPPATLAASAPATGENLASIAAWLRHSGKEGYLAAEVADAAGIPRSEAEDSLGVSQRGFRSGEVLRVAQISTDAKREFLLFMAQHPDGSVLFFVSTPREGLKRAFISLPHLGAVLPWQGEEARAGFAREISYWEERSAGL